MCVKESEGLSKSERRDSGIGLQAHQSAPDQHDHLVDHIARRVWSDKEARDMARKNKNKMLPYPAAQFHRGVAERAVEPPHEEDDDAAHHHRHDSPVHRLS